MFRNSLLSPALAATAMAVFVPGCSSGGGSSAGGGNQATASIHSLVGDWTLRRIEGQNVAGLVPEGWGQSPGLTIAADGKVSGSGGVNRLMSSLDLSGVSRGEFSLSPVASTMMAGPPEAMRLEHLYTNALGRVTGFNIEGNSLNLTGEGRTLLSLIRGP